MEKAAEGKSAPDLDLATDGGGRVRLSDFAGKAVVLYFYPADDTETCTIEAVGFSARLADFRKAGVAVIGISPDTVKSHDRFKAKHQLGLTLAADVERTAIEAYGLWGEKSNFGRKYMGVERATFLIDKQGRIARAWRKVRLKGHVEEVLAAAKSL